jgi:acetate---CoA ligase (ADP-forming)
VTGAAPDVEIHGVLVRKMIPHGHEVILGAKRDPGFGPTVMFGFGGIYVEYFKDVTFALAPVDRITAAKMVRQIRAYPLLEGARGGRRADIEAIAECLIRVGQLVSDFDRITELDVNPLIVAREGNMVADVRIRTKG